MNSAHLQTLKCITAQICYYGNPTKTSLNVDSPLLTHAVLTCARLFKTTMRHSLHISAAKYIAKYQLMLRISDEFEVLRYGRVFYSARAFKEDCELIRVITRTFATAVGWHIVLP